MWIYPILSLHCNTCAVDVQIYKCDRVFHHSMCQTLGCKGFFLPSAGSLETPKGGMPDVTYLQGCGASVQKPKKNSSKMPIPILSNHPISQFNISHLLISSGSTSSIQNSTRSTHWAALLGQGVGTVHHLLRLERLGNLQQSLLSLMAIPGTQIGGTYHI